MKNKLILLVGVALILSSCGEAPLASVSSDQVQEVINTEISEVSQSQRPDEELHQ